MTTPETFRLVYASIVLGSVLAGSTITDPYPRLSKLLRVLGFLSGSALLLISPTELMPYQVILTILASVTAIGISIHNEGYYKVMYGVSRYFQVITDLILASLILLYSSIYFIEIIVYWFFLDIVVAFIAITMEHGAENLPVASTYIAMCIAPSDIAILAIWALLASQYGLFSSMLLQLNTLAGVKTPLDTALSILIISGLAIKLGQFPLHSWPPIVYSRAPSHVSALMSGLVSKMGIYGILLASNIFILDKTAFYVLLAQGLISAVYGSFGAILQTDIKRILAYSSIAYGGLIASVYASSMILGRQELVILTLLLVIYHTLTKSLAFVNTGLIYQLANTYDVYRLGYLYYISREGSLAAYLALLNMTGIPPSTGFLIKLLLLGSSILIAQENPIGLPLVIAIVLSAIFSMAYSAKFIGAYLSTLPRITPRAVPIPRSEINSELYLGFTTLIAPLVLVGYLVITGLFESIVAWVSLPIYALTLIVSLSLFRTIMRKPPVPEDVKYWVSGVES